MDRSSPLLLEGVRCKEGGEGEGKKESPMSSTSRYDGRGREEAEE